MPYAKPSKFALQTLCRGAAPFRSRKWKGGGRRQGAGGEAHCDRLPPRLSDHYFWIANLGRRWDELGGGLYSVDAASWPVCLGLVFVLVFLFSVPSSRSFIDLATLANKLKRD